MKDNPVFPFSAIVGQERLKLALILNAVNPSVGGVLIRGEKGTAKSTAVRALAALLPEIEVASECPFLCDPSVSRLLCERCRKADRSIRGVKRRIAVVTLPLNATEDCVTGGIDFNRAVKTGMRSFQPGLLARVHRGILYVDEVNLLDDHIVDIILDAAASGINVIEREGISFVHDSRFILVGTMNPEEGELRPQLLDRFGLCVEITSEKDAENRVLLTHRREEFDNDPKAFMERFREKNKNISDRIATARGLLQEVIFPESLRSLVAELCVENHVAGHRADLVIEQAAKAMAAYHGQREVTTEEVRSVAMMALLHRKRDAAPPPPPPPPPEHDHDHEQSPDNNEQEKPPEENQNPQEQDKSEGQAPLEENPEHAESPDNKDSENSPKNQEQNSEPLEQIFDVGETFRVKKFASPKDRVLRRGSGRRSRTRISMKQGRYVKSTFNRNTGDVSLDATLRAAAPYQLRRKNGNGLAVILQAEDIREKVREKRIGNFLLFLVDASGSMGARGRMSASKGAIMSLLLDAYQKRDRIAMISFRKNEAVVNLPPTSSIELAAGLLKEMPVGGRTPLSAGLVRSYEMIRNYLFREPTARPIVIIITDGKSNVALGEKKPLEESLSIASRLAADDRIRMIVVDVETQGLVQFGLAQKLAGAMNAAYYKIEDLKADTLVNIVKGNH